MKILGAEVEVIHLRFDKEIEDVLDRFAEANVNALSMRQYGQPMVNPRRSVNYKRFKRAMAEELQRIAEEAVQAGENSS